MNMTPPLYEKLFGRNPSTELLCTIVDLAESEPTVTDTFIRKVNEEGMKSKTAILEEIRRGGQKRAAENPKIILGDDKAYVTFIVHHPGTGKFKPGKLIDSIYYVGWTQDECLDEWVYVDFRIPKRFRDALDRFATSHPFQVGDRLPDFTMGVRIGQTYDPLSRWIEENDRDLRRAMAAALARTGETTLTIV
jgi:hypothetical protein